MDATTEFLLGKCQRRLHSCPYCPLSCPARRGRITPNPRIKGRDLYSDWMRTLVCPTCSSKWFVCIECGQCRTHIKDSAMARRHHRLYHLEGTTPKPSLPSLEMPPSRSPPRSLTVASPPSTASDSIQHPKKRRKVVVGAEFHESFVRLSQPRKNGGGGHLLPVPS